MAFSCWRPFFQPSQFWTPSLSMRGVQFHPILYSGRHGVLLLASILPTFSILDAPHFLTWRPFPSHPLFWTPLTSIRGVQFHLILYSGRHVHHSLASILPTFSILDACHVHTWRPIPSHPQLWTPCPSLSGVHPSNLLNFGRLSHPCVASNSISSLILDAPHFLTWRPFPSLPLFWTPRKEVRGVQN